MKTKEYAILFIQAYEQNYIYDLSKWCEDDIHIERCSSACDACPAPCALLSNLNGKPDHDTFIKNYKPVDTYLRKHNPEWFI